MAIQVRDGKILALPGGGISVNADCCCFTDCGILCNENTAPSGWSVDISGITDGSGCGASEDCTTIDGVYAIDTGPFPGAFGICRWQDEIFSYDPSVWEDCLPSSCSDPCGLLLQIDIDSTLVELTIFGNTCRTVGGQATGWLFRFVPGTQPLNCDEITDETMTFIAYSGVECPDTLGTFCDIGNATVKLTAVP
jgi:hypothetical protein